jgi:hypothetical protein
MLSRRTSAVVLLCFFAAAESGCVPIPRTYTEEQLIGEYQIQYSFGTDTLILNADNTYEQRFLDKAGKAYVHRGKWDFEGGRNNQVALINAVDVCDGFGRFAGTEPHRGYSLRSFGWYRGTVVSVNEDLGLYMQKLR